MKKKLYKIDASQVLPYKPIIKEVSLEDIVKELNKLQSLYKYCINKKDIALILKKERRKTYTKYGDMLLGFGKKK
tara:strand:+ start:186 stop:410 length:225 start_codon:yes stop_codon:yes gene_type:complete